MWFQSIYKGYLSTNSTGRESHYFCIHFKQYLIQLSRSHSTRQSINLLPSLIIPIMKYIPVLLLVAPMTMAQVHWWCNSGWSAPAKDILSRQCLAASNFGYVCVCFALYVITLKINLSTVPLVYTSRHFGRKQRSCHLSICKVRVLYGWSKHLYLLGRQCEGNFWGKKVAFYI